ncbi:MAG: PD40 domain-containing protein [Solirubrobacterales bacterium]|nr:PD40 domain-containing protein [Solirubrobacterales bacterium]
MTERRIRSRGRNHMGDISSRVKASTIGAVLLALAFCAPATAGPAGPGTTFPITYLDLPAGSVAGGPSGLSGPGYGQSPVSGDGRFVLFTSTSNNLVADADRDQNNLFRKDTQTGDVVMVNRLTGKNGTSTAGDLYSYAISSNGKRVAFVTSDQADPGDTDDKSDVYLRDIPAGTTTLLTPGTADYFGEVDISGDGNYVTYSTVNAMVGGDGNADTDIYRQKVDGGSPELVSRIPAAVTAGNDRSSEPTISSDGRWVAFSSVATDLVTGFTDGNGGFNSDVYARDMNLGSTYLVSSRYDSTTTGGNDESSEPDLAGTAAAIGGLRIAYSSWATNLADNGITDPDSQSSVYYKTMGATASELVSRATGPAGANANSRAHTPSISADGTRIVFSSDATNLGAPPDYYGVYMRDRSNSSTSLVSARTEYAVSGTIAGDGSLAAWTEQGGATADSDPDLTGVFSRTVPSGPIKLVSRPKGSEKVLAPGFYPDFGESGKVLSDDGRYVVFSAATSRLEGGSTNKPEVYRRDLATGKIELVSRASGVGGAVSEGADNPSISNDGNLIAFSSWSSLDAADGNTEGDVYVRDMTSHQTVLASRADGVAGAVAGNGADIPSISGNGKRVAFRSDSSNLGAPGGTDRVFVRDLEAGKTIVASRADGVAGAIADASSTRPMLSDDGDRVMFMSSAANLDPDDLNGMQSVYVRDLGANDTTLVSRAPGLTGASLSDFVYDATMSGDGTRVAFVTPQDAAVPATAPWPVGFGQVVLRNLTDGSNTLISQSAGGQPGESSSRDASLNRDGSVIAFETTSQNIRPEIDYSNRSTVVVEDLSDGSIGGPPAFGSPTVSMTGSSSPFVSSNGLCVVFTALGHNAISGDLGDVESGYVYARAPGCQNPRAIAPKLSRVTMKPARFRVAKGRTATVAKRARKAPRGTRIAFTLNTGADVTISIEQRLKGRRVKGKCVRATKVNRRKKACARFVKRGKLVRRDLGAGRTVVKFTGRVGKKALKPGRYRIRVRAVNATGASKTVNRAFRVVKR